MATPLDNLQAAYAGVCQKIQDVLANPQPSYSIDGLNVSKEAYYSMLLDNEEKLRKIPGVAPTTTPIFTILG